MRLQLPVSLARGGDACLFVGVRKTRNGREVAFENAYGFRGSLVTHGIRRLSHYARGADGRPRDDTAEDLVASQVVPLAVDLLPSATLFEAGSELHLEIAGRWFYARNPLTGQFPAYYERSARGRCTVHLGSEGGAWLQVPVQPVPPPPMTRMGAVDQRVASNYSEASES